MATISPPRADMFAQLTCEAANNVLARPITVATSLHIKCRATKNILKCQITTSTSLYIKLKAP